MICRVEHVTASPPDNDDYLLQQLGSAEERGENLEATAYQVGDQHGWERTLLLQSIRRLLEGDLIEGRVIGGWQEADARALLRRVTANGWDRIERLRKQTDLSD